MNVPLDAFYFILRDQVSYQELGPNYLDELNKKHLVHYHLRRLESLGLKVQVREAQSTSATSGQGRFILMDFQPQGQRHRLPLVLTLVTLGLINQQNSLECVMHFEV